MIINQSMITMMKKNDCRYQLVVQTAKRARQLVAGAEPLVNCSSNKPVSIAIQELAEGKVLADHLVTE